MNAVGAYVARRSGADQDALVMRHAELVKRIAYHLAGRLPPSVDVADLIQAGMLGLLQAADHYAANRGASFETYAGIRIRGAMIDVPFEKRNPRIAMIGTGGRGTSLLGKLLAADKHVMVMFVPAAAAGAESLGDPRLGLERTERQDERAGRVHRAVRFG